MKILLNNREEEFDKETMSVAEMLMLKKFSFKMRIIKDKRNPDIKRELRFHILFMMEIMSDALSDERRLKKNCRFVYE